ncbi:SDR family oxidoreductase [Irregularibacter muris]|uniref:SDR family oxidoreductase n=1 Tax=Irregularibacter muris TaxID=1796619 RepID=A0AAE3HJ45_9FIRM|nr:SDR family oxidoreductase [Irregularibacter muris]MCR1899633.1 SDR family oxidoreductase [Irregularibacter muris]
MKEKIVTITGAGSGLGARLAKKYSEEGAKVVLLDISKENLSRVSESLPGENHTYVVDISSNENVNKVFNLIYSEVGGIDILINCAGIGRFDLAEKIDGSSVDAMIDINLKGTIYCTQQVISSMKKRNQGQIINIISMSGKRPVVTESVYCASKYGVTGFTQALALELENTNVRVMGVYMGNMATELWKGEKPDNFNKFISPDDMADIIMENAKYRNNLSIEEVMVKNIRN